MSSAPSPRLTGAKGAPGVAERIISAMPEHSLYLEAFAGRATVGLRKRPAALEVYVDRDPSRASALRARVPASTIVLCGDVTRVVDPTRVPASALVYADPPYLFDTRRAGRRRYYRHEFGTLEEHTRLLEWLEALPCAVLLSGYPSALYLERLRPFRWHVTEYLTRTRGATVTECLWQNFAPGAGELHDTRYVGAGFRERERIRRKVARWIRRLKQLPHAERAAVLAAFDGEGLTRRK